MFEIRSTDLKNGYKTPNAAADNSFHGQKTLMPLVFVMHTNNENVSSETPTKKNKDNQEKNSSDKYNKKKRYRIANPKVVVTRKQQKKFIYNSIRIFLFLVLLISIASLCSTPQSTVVTVQPSYKKICI